MLKLPIQEFEKRVEQGFLRKVENDALVLYTYTPRCVGEQAWDEYTRLARGLILHKTSGMVVAMPFPKFFNLGARPETMEEALPKEHYRVFEKVDGSLGIVYFWAGSWRVATKGAFASDQAVKGAEILHEKYPRFRDFANIRTTYLVEIVYPGNRVVVDYQGEEKLVLLGGYNTENGEEMTFTEFHTQATLFRMPAAVDFMITLPEAIALTETMGKNTEGFVIRFENGLRVKLKGHEYSRIHRIISELSPLSLWGM
jgi:RNA ligase